MHLIEQGVKIARKPTKTEAPELPKPLKQALAANPAVQQNFTKLSPSHQREYIEWVTEARTEPTINKRIDTTIAWLTEGKSRNWKYERK